MSLKSLAQIKKLKWFFWNIIDVFVFIKFQFINSDSAPPFYLLSSWAEYLIFLGVSSVNRILSRKKWREITNEDWARTEAASEADICEISERKLHNHVYIIRHVSLGRESFHMYIRGFTKFGIKVAWRLQFLE